MVRISWLDIITIVGALSLVLILSTAALIAFTSIREYIPGYASTALRNKALNLSLKADSLEEVIRQHNLYIGNLKNILTNDVQTFSNEEAKDMPEDELVPNNDEDTREIDSILYPSKQDSIFRKNMERTFKYENIFERTKQTDLDFFAVDLQSPVKGIITNGYNFENGHLGVDIACSKGEPIKSVLDGTVILAEWTFNTGHTILIKHDNNMFSVYKHNSYLLRQQGDVVKSGEVIAVAGSTGKHSSGPHLHFELWIRGISVNPTDFIRF